MQASRLENMIVVKYDQLKSSLRDLSADSHSEQDLILIDRLGNRVDASYNGRKYRILSNENQYYSIGERIARVLRAFFIVLATLGFILFDCNKRQEVYGLFCRKYFSITAVTRYRKNNSEQVSAIINLLRQQPTLEMLKSKCKEIGFHPNLKDWRTYDLKYISQPLDIDIIEYFVNKSKDIYHDENERCRFFTLMLWGVLMSLAKPSHKAHQIRSSIGKADGIIRRLVNQGADFNLVLKYNPTNWHLLPVQSSLKEAFSYKISNESRTLLLCFLYKLFEIDSCCKKINAILNQSDYFTNCFPISFPKFFTLCKSGDSDDIKWQILEAKMKKSRTSPEEKINIYAMLADIAMKSNTVVQSLLQAYGSTISLLLDLGAKTTRDIVPLLRRRYTLFPRMDYFRCMVQHVVDFIRDNKKMFPSFLMLQQGAIDEGSAFMQLPKELIKIMGELILPRLAEFKFPMQK